MDPITIRKATLADTQAISSVHCSTVDTWYAPQSRQPTPYEALDLYGRWMNGGPWMSPELCAVHLNALLLQGQLVLVAEAAGQVIGEAEYYINHEAAPFWDSLHLSILYVHRDWQRQGVGHALVLAGVQYAQDMALPWLTTQPEDAAITFYQRLGFRPWLRAREMQLRAEGPPPTDLQLLTVNTRPPADLGLRIGRYQCSTQGWGMLWPDLALPQWLALRRWLWQTSVNGKTVLLGLREQVRDQSQADGYAWLSPETPLTPVVGALRALGAAQGFNAVDLLLAEEDIPVLRRTFRLDYQTTVRLWRRETKREADHKA